MSEMWAKYHSGAEAHPGDGAEEEPDEARPGPGMLLKYFQNAEESWVCSAEIIGALYVAVSSLCALGTHLAAFKEDRAARYAVASVPSIRVLREAVALVDPEDEDGKAKELALRDGCLEQVIGPLLRRDTFDKEIQKIVAEAEVDSKEVFKGTVPDFMRKFLDEMKEASHEDCLEAALGLRDWCDLLRDTTLLALGDVLFGELTA